MIDARKHRKLMTILSKMGISDDQRHDLIYSWTQGRTKSTTELQSDELQNLLWKLEHDFNFQTSIEPYLQLDLKKKRSQVLAIAQRCDIHDGTSFVKFNRFMLNSSKFKKPLNKHSLEELDVLIKQFRGLEQNYMRSAAQAGTKAYNHAHGFADLFTN